MKLNGILDPAVMGGIDNYEKAFLNADYRDNHLEESSDLLKLEGLIAEQIPLLSIGLQLHRARAPVELAPFHQRLEQCFTSMRNQVETKYGKRVRNSIELFIRTFFLNYFLILLCFLCRHVICKLRV